MFNSTNHKGNANQRHHEIPPYTTQNGYYKKDRWLPEMWMLGVGKMNEGSQKVKKIIQRLKKAKYKNR